MRLRGNPRSKLVVAYAVGHPNHVAAWRGNLRLNGAKGESEQTIPRSKTSPDNDSWVSRCSNLSGSRNGRRYWLCLCDCGKTISLPTESLGHTKSCGCARSRFKDIPLGTKFGRLVVVNSLTVEATIRLQHGSASVIAEKRLSLPVKPCELGTNNRADAVRKSMPKRWLTIT